MSRLLLFTLLIYIVLASEPCNQDKKGKPDIRVIELDDDDSSEEFKRILTLHIPDRRRRAVDSEKRSSFCTKDEDCGPGAICFARLTCVMGTWRTLNSLETSTAN